MGCDLMEINQKVEGIWDSSLMSRKILGEISVTTVEPLVKTYCVPSIFIKGRWALSQLERWDPSDIKVAAIDKTGLRIPTQPPPVSPYMWVLPEGSLRYLNPHPFHFGSPEPSISLSSKLTALSRDLTGIWLVNPFPFFYSSKLHFQNNGAITDNFPV